MSDLIDSVESLLQSRLGKSAAEALDVSADGTRTALRLIAPAIMAGVAEQCASVDQADDLLMTLRGARKTDPTGADLIKLLSERAPHVGARAPTFLSQLLFGAQQGAVVDAIAAASALEARPVSHLLEMSIMATFSMLREHASDEGWDGARMRQALQLERMLIKMDLDRGVARATGFDWLASDDPSAPLFKPKASTASDPPVGGRPAASASAADRNGSAASGSGDQSAKSPAARPRKSMVDLLHARMAQGSLPSATPAAPQTPGHAPGRSVYAERRLDEWLEPMRRSALGATSASSASGEATARLEPATEPAAEPAVPPVPNQQIEHAAQTVRQVDTTTAAGSQVGFDADVTADGAVRDVRLEIKAAIEIEAAPEAPALAPAPEPDEVEAAPADELHEFEKTMPLPFAFARHLATAQWPFSIFAARDAVYLDAPASHPSSAVLHDELSRAIAARASIAGSRAAARTSAPWTSAAPTRPATTIAHDPAPLAQSASAAAPLPHQRAATTAPTRPVVLPAPSEPIDFSDDVSTDPKQSPSKSISTWWLGPVVIAAAVVALVILSYRISGGRPAPSPAPDGAPPVAQPEPAAPKGNVPAAPSGVPGTAGEAKPPAEPPAMLALALPGGAQMQVRDAGLIAGLVRALNQPGNEAGQRFVMDEVSFDRDTAMLAPGADTQLRQLSEVLQAYPQLKIRIEGHTDRDGDTSVIRALSTDRAASVKASLILNGIGEDRVQSQGFGADRPLSTSTSAQERAQNRRIEVVIAER